MSKYIRWLVLPLLLIILSWIVIVNRKAGNFLGVGQTITIGIYFVLSIFLIIITIKLKLTYFYHGFSFILFSIFLFLISSIWPGPEWLRTIAFMVLLPVGLILILIDLILVFHKQENFIQQMNATEDRFHLIFENARDAIFIEDLDGKILEVNQAACDMFGYSKAEFSKLSVHDLVPLEAYEKIPDLHPSAKPNGKFYLREVFNLHKSGQKIPVEVSANRIQLSGKSVVVAIVRDISERKKNEKSLIVTNHRLRLFNQISLLIHKFRDVEKLLVAVSHDLKTWLKGSAFVAFLADEALGVMSRVQQENFPDDFPHTLSMNVLNKLFSGDVIKVQYFSNLATKKMMDEFDLFTESSRENIHSLILLPLYAQEKLVALTIVGSLKYKIRKDDLSLLQTICNHIGVAIENINLYCETRGWALELESRVKQRTLELGRSEKRFRQMVESIKDGFFTIDQQQTLTYWNSGFEQTTGLSREQIKNKPLFEVWPDLPRNEVTKIIQQVNQTRQFQALQFSIADTTDSEWLSLRFYPWEEGIAVFYDNITEQKKFEAALKTANEDLQSFAYSVSHDLRAPLRAIDGFAKVLSDELPKGLDETLWHYLDRIRSGAKNLNALINDLLVFSRVTRQEARRYEINTREVFENLIQEIRELEPERNIEFNLGALPVVKCDLHLFETLCRNLISNAVKFTRPRKKAVIEIGSLPDQTQHIIFIKDNGVGFEMKYQDRIFGVFQRLHQSDEFEGTGIGLATVKRIVEKYGGQIWAESAENEGTTFFFYL